MLEAKWEAVVKLALIQEPRLGEKLLPLRALKETRYNITVGSHDKPARDAATHMIGAYTEAINKITTAVWGEARGIRVEECPPPAGSPGGTLSPVEGPPNFGPAPAGIPIGSPPSLGKPLPPPPASSLASAPLVPHTAPVAPAAVPPAPIRTAMPTDQALGAGTLKAAQEPAPRAPQVSTGAVPQDALLAGLLEEMRKKLKAEIEAEVRQDTQRMEQGIRQKIESEVAASILETNKKAELQDTMMMIMDGKQLVQEVWQLWANLETVMSQSKDEELRKHIFVAEEKLHALIMLASRLLPVAVVEDRVHKSTHKK